MCGTPQFVLAFTYQVLSFILLEMGDDTINIHETYLLQI